MTDMTSLDGVASSRKFPNWAHCVHRDSFVRDGEPLGPRTGEDLERGGLGREKGQTDMYALAGHLNSSSSRGAGATSWQHRASVLQFLLLGKGSSNHWLAVAFCAKKLLQFGRGLTVCTLKVFPDSRSS